MIDHSWCNDSYLHISLQALLKGPFALDIQADLVEVFFPFAPTIKRQICKQQKYTPRANCLNKEVEKKVSSDLKSTSRHMIC